ncbi:MAG: hypothetical protein VBE63_26215, partial [Lamprobacter sp.]|uniref:hypothetical protein n=1 Tax=Lamprobacter sp. TaxID=3100796 RepID=UPI002B2573B1
RLPGPSESSTTATACISVCAGQQLPSRRTFFEHLRALTLYTVYASWEELFTFMLEMLEPAQPPPKGRRLKR